MTNEELKAALENLIAEAMAKGSGKAPTKAEVEAVIRATRLTPGQPIHSWEVDTAREDLREAMLERMRILQASIMTLNTIADEMMEAARLFDSESAARALRRHAQQRRIRALEMQGELAVLSERYAARFSADS